MLQQRVSEVRTQVYLPAVWHRKLQDAAKKRGVSMAMVIRDAVKEKYDLTEDQTQKDKEKAWKEFMKMAGFAKDKYGTTDVSARTGYYYAKALEAKLKRKGHM